MPRRPFTPRGFGGALVVVSAVYKPEAKGYLELRCGDRLTLLCAECVKGSNGNTYPEYAYGRRVRERETHRSLLTETHRVGFRSNWCIMYLRQRPLFAGSGVWSFASPQRKAPTGLWHLSSSL